jgi:polysaccharide pyruvyl transferase WcaK-like protein
VAVKDLARAHGDDIVVLTPNPEHTAIALPRTRLSAYGMDASRGTVSRAIVWATRSVSGSPLQRLGLRLLKQNPRLVGAPEWLRVLASGSRLHLVGGGYFTDLFDLDYFLRPLRVARSMGLSVTTSPLGLGPFAGTTSAAKVATALRTARVVVRDETSLRFCREHGLVAEEQPDDGFRLREVIRTRSPEPEHRPGGRRLGICIFSQYDDGRSLALEAWWVACLRHLAGMRPGWRFTGFCFHTATEMDYDTTRRLFAKADLDPGAVRRPVADPEQAVAGLQVFDAILSTRFHAVVAAVQFEIPCVAVAVNEYYEIKMRCAARHSPQPLPVLNPVHTAPEAVAGCLQRLVSVSRQPQRPSLR